MVPTWLLKPLEKYTVTRQRLTTTSALCCWAELLTKGHPLLGSSLFPTATWVSANIWTLKNIYRQTDFYMASKTLVSHLKFHFRNKKKKATKEQYWWSSWSPLPGTNRKMNSQIHQDPETQWYLSSLIKPWNQTQKWKTPRTRHKISLLHAQWNFP